MLLACAPPPPSPPTTTKLIHWSDALSDTNIGLRLGLGMGLNTDPDAPSAAVSVDVWLTEDFDPIEHRIGYALGIPYDIHHNVVRTKGGLSSMRCHS